MNRIITIGFLIVALTAFGAAGWKLPFVAADDAQAAENEMERAAEEAEFGAERTRDSSAFSCFASCRLLILHHYKATRKNTHQR